MLHLIHSPPPHPLPFIQCFLNALLSCLPLSFPPPHCSLLLISSSFTSFTHVLLILHLILHLLPPYLQTPTQSTVLIPHSSSFTHLLFNPLPPFTYSLFNLLHPDLLAPTSATPFSHPLNSPHSSLCTPPTVSSLLSINTSSFPTLSLIHSPPAPPIPYSLTSYSP